MSHRTAVLHVPEHDIRVRFVFDEGRNEATAAAVWEALPFDSVIGHQVIAGGGLWVITRLQYNGPRVSVRRTPGSVYFYPLINSLNFTYDDVRETAHVNEFARVLDEDLPRLAALGRLVWDRTIAVQAREPIRVRVERLEER